MGLNEMVANAALKSAQDKCCGIPWKSPLTWARICGIIGSIATMVSGFATINQVTGGNNAWAIIFGIVTVCIEFLWFLKCIACSKDFSEVAEKYLGNLWVKMGIYLVVGIFGMVILAETCKNANCQKGAGLYVAYALDIFAGIFYGAWAVFEIYNKKAEKSSQLGDEEDGTSEKTGLFR